MHTDMTVKTLQVMLSNSYQRIFVTKKLHNHENDCSLKTFKSS